MEGCEGGGVQGWRDVSMEGYKKCLSSKYFIVMFNY